MNRGNRFALCLVLLVSTVVTGLAEDNKKKLGTNNLDVADVILKWVDANVTGKSKVRNERKQDVAQVSRVNE